jgi:SAM-dependent methyltransferase
MGPERKRHMPKAASDLNRDFLKEYSSDDSVRKYSKATAGTGIDYLLHHDYGEIYLEVIEKHLPKSRLKSGLRVWEFGCGAGMNLLHLLGVLAQHDIRVDCAYGTDFSETLLEVARRQAASYLTPEQNSKVHFCAARNERLLEDVTNAEGIAPETLLASFDLIFGVNTMRYCHRLATEDKCAAGIRTLLCDGGVCIVIDMNQKFPAFRSRLRDRIIKEKRAYYLPSLDEYVRQFSSAGFEILKSEIFCWIPHSAGSALTTVMRTLTPLLNAVVPNHAMRSLVISRKTPLPRA